MRAPLVSELGLLSLVEPAVSNKTVHCTLFPAEGALQEALAQGQVLQAREVVIFRQVVGYDLWPLDARSGYVALTPAVSCRLLIPRALFEVMRGLVGKDLSSCRLPVQQRLC